MYGHFIIITLSILFLPSFLHDAYSHGFPESQDPQLEYVVDTFFLNDGQNKIPIGIGNNINRINEFVFDSKHDSITFTIPLMSQINPNATNFHAVIHIPKSFAIISENKPLKGYINGIEVSGKMLIQDPYSIEDTNIVNFILNKNELDDILTNTTKSDFIELKIVLSIVKKNISDYATGTRNNWQQSPCDDMLPHMQYQIRGGSVESCMVYDSTNSMVIALNPTSDGNLTIKFPQYVDGWKNVCNNVQFLIYANHKIISFDEDKSFFMRTLHILFTKNTTQLEIQPIRIDDSGPSLNCISTNSIKEKSLSNTTLDVITCDNNFVLIKKITDDSLNCVSLLTSDSLIQRGWGKMQYSDSFELTLSPANTVSINYDIQNGQINDIKSDIRTNSFVIELDSVENGHLTILLPRYLIDARLGTDEKSGDDSFFVLVDGAEADYTEKTNHLFRELTIPFSSFSKQIEIIGTNPSF